MRQKTLFLTLAAIAAALLMAPEARAWGRGGYHVGYTHVGYGGVQHWGHTSVAGPYGGYSGSHYGAYGRYGGSYHAGYGGGYREGYGGGYHSYSAYGSSAGYHYGGYHYGGVYGTGYAGGVYRAW